MDVKPNAQAGRRPALARWLCLCAGVALAPPVLAEANLQAEVEITASALMDEGSDHVEYAMAVVNAGSTHASAVKVLVRLPDEFVQPAWTCVAEGGASCGLAAGEGDVLFETEMPAGSAVRFALVTGISDPRQQGVWLGVETVTASSESDTADNIATVLYRRCSASRELPASGDPPVHPCAFVDSFEPM